MPDSALIPHVSSRELSISTAKVVADIVRLLVHRPDKVDMQIRNDGKTVTLLLFVAPEDIGKVIGRQGRTARSLRIVLNSISSKTGIPFELNIDTERT